jgi:hypothetical protein
MKWRQFELTTALYCRQITNGHPGDSYLQFSEGVPPRSRVKIFLPSFAPRFASFAAKGSSRGRQNAEAFNREARKGDAKVAKISSKNELAHCLGD